MLESHYWRKILQKTEIENAGNKGQHGFINETLF